MLILHANGFEAYEVSVFTDVLGWAVTFGSQPIRIVTAGLHQTLKRTFGFRAMPDSLVEDLGLDTGEMNPSPVPF